MTKIEAMKRALSAEALAELGVQGGEFPGFVVQIDPTKDARSTRLLLAELRAHDVIGPNDGLTIIGSGLVAKLKAELLDALF